MTTEETGTPTPAATTGATPPPGPSTPPRPLVPTAVGAPEPVPVPEPEAPSVTRDTWVSPTGSPPTGPLPEGPLPEGPLPEGPLPDGPTPPPRRHRARVVAIVAVAVVIVAGVLAAVATWGRSSKTVAVGPVAAAHLVEASLSAAHRTGSFHYVSVSTGAGATQVTTGDAGPGSGRQTITIGAHTFRVLVIGTTAYFQGDAVSMQDELGLDPLVSQQHAGQWISLQPTDSPYQSVYAAVTTSSALADSITISGKAILPATTVAGVHVTPIRGGLTPVDQTPTKGTARLYVRASGSPLPVRFTGSGVVSNQATTFRTDFSKWGESVVVPAPSVAVAYSTISLGGLSQRGNPTILT